MEIPDEIQFLFDGVIVDGEKYYKPKDSNMFTVEEIRNMKNIKWCEPVKITNKSFIHQ